MSGNPPKPEWNPSDNVFEIDSYEPDYANECCNCGQIPCVTAVNNGEVVYQFDMCGPCTFLTAKALDPAWWNGNE